MPIIEVQEYSDERLLNTIKNYHHNSEETVKAAMEEIVKRGIATEEEVQQLLAEGREKEVERDARLEAEYQAKITPKRSFRVPFQVSVLLVCAAIAVYFYFVADMILIPIVAFAGGGLAVARMRRR